MLLAWHAETPATRWREWDAGVRTHSPRKGTVSEEEAAVWWAWKSQEDSFVPTVDLSSCGLVNTMAYRGGTFEERFGLGFSAGSYKRVRGGWNSRLQSLCVNLPLLPAAEGSTLSSL